MNQQLGDRLRFLRAFAANPREVGRDPADVPVRGSATCSTSATSRAPACRRARGRGTGVQTGEILAG